MSGVSVAGGGGVGGDVTVEAQLALLLERLEAGRRDHAAAVGRPAMIAEVRTLELWRAVIAECLATVFYVFLVCGAYSPWTAKTPTPENGVQLNIALVAGFAMTILVHSFGQVSGGHVNPAVTVALACARRVSPLRAAMYILAQLGGGIAGAALLYGATSSGYNTDLGATVPRLGVSPLQAFGLEFLLTFVVVFVVFASVNPYKRSFGNPATAIGLSYLSCTLVGFPLTGASMNPARSLGPAFVMNKWDVHWVYWCAPLLGGILAGLIYEYIFNPHRTPRSRKDSLDGECLGVESYPLNPVYGYGVTGSASVITRESELLGSSSMVGQRAYTPGALVHGGNPTMPLHGHQGSFYPGPLQNNNNQAAVQHYEANHYPPPPTQYHPNHQRA